VSDVVDDSSGADGADPLAAEDGTEVAVASGPLVGPVLRRVVGMLAARADLPLDRLDDAVLVADVVATRATAYAPDAVQVRLQPGERTLWLRVGPLARGGAEALLSETAVPDLGSVILKLADEVQVEAAPDADAEYLRVRLAYGG
jgi:serine/threonine-protein kinase RsbW